MTLWIDRFPNRYHLSGEHRFFKPSGSDDDCEGLHVIQRPISRSEWDEFRATIDACAFWSMPTEASKCGLDGDHLYLDGVLEGRYHSVHRWSPDDDAFYAMFACIQRLANIQSVSPYIE
jgi:hypothetical protein